MDKNEVNKKLHEKAHRMHARLREEHEARS